MSTARRCLTSPRSLSSTSAQPTMVTQVNIMVMNGWLTSFLFIVNLPPHSWDKAISDSDLETPRSGSCVWSKGKVIQSAQYHINSLPFHFTSIRPTISEIELFRNLTLKHPRSRAWVRSRSISHIVPSIQPMHFLFFSHQSDQPFLRYGQNSVWPWKNISKFLKKICQSNSFQQNFSEISSGNNMTRVTKLPRFVVIRWVVLTLSCRQANFC